MLRLRFYHTPLGFQWLFPELTWRLPSNEKAIYLTFDDGPSPEGTPWILDQLKRFNAFGSFFCVGDNAQRYPILLNQIKAEGHQLGNHTQHHLDGWEVSNAEYLDNVALANQWIDSDLFRPPYGKITPRQWRQLLNKGYRVIMWNVLSYDFDSNINMEVALKKCLNWTKPGSIVVFHDHPKALPQLKEMLPAYLNQLRQNGYHFSHF